uniref:Uncharacterized protein n=1 Tax=Knipowitschia caucasica TaxID=637954 RepID=A0AAV2MRX8_KNICA
MSDAFDGRLTVHNKVESGYTTNMIGKLDYISGSHSVSNRVEAWTRDAGLLLSQEGRPVIDLVGNIWRLYFPHITILVKEGVV